MTTSCRVVPPKKAIDPEFVQIPCPSTERTTYDPTAPPDRARRGTADWYLVHSVSSFRPVEWSARLGRSEPAKSGHSFGRYMLGRWVFTRILKEMPIAHGARTNRGQRRPRLARSWSNRGRSWPNLRHDLWPFAASADGAHGTAPVGPRSSGRRAPHGSRDSTGDPPTLSRFRATPPSRCLPGPA